MSFIEESKNVWDLYNVGYYVCITTNGIVKKDGSLVMGAGIARQAALKFPELPKLLGELVQKNGNHVNVLSNRIISFPTKNNWKDNSDIKLIEQSAKELMFKTEIFPNIKVAMPRPGCGLGGLNWVEVRPVLE